MDTLVLRKNIVPMIVLLMLLISAMAPLATGIYIGKRITMDIGDNYLTEGGATAIIVAVKDVDGNPADLITVHIDATYGTFDEDSRVSNALGQVAFTYFAPSTVSGTLDDTITASATMGQDFETSGVIRVTSRMTVSVDGPRQLQTDGGTVTYDVDVDSGGQPVSGATVTVDKAGPGTLDEVGGATGADGGTWFTFTPPSGTGETVFRVNATHSSQGTASTSFRVLIQEDLAPLVVSVEADGQPLPCWGSCNLTATVTRSGDPVEGAYVSWEVSKGWLERATGNTDASGRLSVVYTAMGDGPGLWAGDVIVTANVTDGIEWADDEEVVQIASYATAFTPVLKMDATGGQLLDGERFEVEVSLTLPEDAAWEFIKPFDVYLVWMSALGEEMERRLLGEDLAVDGPFTWSSGWHYVFTADEEAAAAGFYFDVLVLSANGHYVYEQLEDPLQVTILVGLADEWTFLVYINGDNDLNEWADYSLDWLESGAPEDGEFTVLVQYDRRSTRTGYVDWRDTRRFELTRHEVNEEIDSQLIEVVGEVDSGSASTVYDFLMWGTQRSPAGHYCLQMWDHGGAYGGSSWDSTSGTHIDNNDLAGALDMFGTHRRKLDVIVFDMCLMSSLSNLYQFKDVVNYMAASETTVLADLVVPELFLGLEEFWPGNRPSPLHVVTQFLNGHMEHVETWEKEMFPFAASDLGKAHALFEDLDALADALIEKWDVVEGVIQEVRWNIDTIDGPYSGRHWLVDAWQLFSEIRDDLEAHPLSDQLQDGVSALEDVLSSLEDVVFYHLPVEEYRGASIFFPRSVITYEDQRDVYIANGLPEDSGWTRLLDAYFFGPPGEDGNDSPFWPMVIDGFLDAPLQDVVVTVSDDDGDGQAEGVDVLFGVENANNVHGVTVLFDLIVNNGSRAGTVDGLVDRRVISVAAGEDREGTVKLTSPVVDWADVLVTVITVDGTVLQEPHMGSYMVNATPGEGTRPTLELSALPLEVAEGEEVTLTATVDDPEEDELTVWWDVDDNDGVGIDVTGTTATTTYRGAGNRSAVCIATDGHWFVVGRVDVTVKADEDNHRPVANLTATALDPADTLKVTFDASGSEDPDGDPMEYAIDFGDGSWRSWQGDPTFDHTYAEAGTYQAILKVRDHARFDGSYSVLPVDTDALVPNAPPVARFEVDADPVAPLQDITANASLSTDPDGGVLEYRFDWGDGEVTPWSQDPVATHAYDEPGEYNITLTVRDDDGAEKEMWSILQVVKDDNDDDDDDGSIPHAGVGIALVALALACLLALVSPDRRRGM